MLMCTILMYYIIIICRNRQGIFCRLMTLTGQSQCGFSFYTILYLSRTLTLVGSERRVRVNVKRRTFWSSYRPCGDLEYHISNDQKSLINTEADWPYATFISGFAGFVSCSSFSSFSKMFEETLLYCNFGWPKGQQNTPNKKKQNVRSIDKAIKRPMIATIYPFKAGISITPGPQEQASLANLHMSPNFITGLGSQWLPGTLLYMTSPTSKKNRLCHISSAPTPRVKAPLFGNAAVTIVNRNEMELMLPSMWCTSLLIDITAAYQALKTIC